MLLLLNRKSFNPRNLPNLQLWLDATRIAQADSTSVATWADQSGNGYDATQGGSAARPTYIASGLNGLPVVRFDGTDDVMSLGASALGMIRNVAGATVFVVVKYPSNNLTNNLLFISISSVSGSNRLNLLQTSIPKYQVAGRRLDAESSQNATSNQNAASNFIIQTAYADFSNTLLQQFINGALDGQKTDFQTAGNTSDTDSNLINIGASGNNTNRLNGDIAEIIVYNRALNTSELAQVHRYLSRKWGIAFA
jgi:hypothetical protein